MRVWSARSHFVPLMMRVNRSQTLLPMNSFSLASENPSQVKDCRELAPWSRESSLWKLESWERKSLENFCNSALKIAKEVVDHLTLFNQSEGYQRSCLFGVSAKSPSKFSQICNGLFQILRHFELLWVFKPSWSKYSTGNLVVGVGLYHVGSSFACVARLWFSEVSWT